MGKLFKDRAGQLGYRRDDEETVYPLPPDATEVINIDFDANPSLLNELTENISRFALSGGILTRDGVPVVLAPDSPRRALYRAAALLNGKRMADLTAAEVRTLVAALLLRAGWLARDGTVMIE